MKSESDKNENVRNILQKLHILITPDKEHKKVFQDIPVVGFRNGKSLKDHLVRAKLPDVAITERSESCGTVEWLLHGVAFIERWFWRDNYLLLLFSI